MSLVGWVLGFVSGALSVLLRLVCFQGATQSIPRLALWIGFGRLMRGFMLTAGAISVEAGAPGAGRPCPVS